MLFRSYRTQDEIADWRQNKDPIDGFSRHLISEGVISVDAFEAMKVEVTKEIDEAVAFAESSPEPDPTSIMVDVDSGLLGVSK